MSTNPNLITYITYLALTIWTLINYAMYVRNKTIDLLIICGVLVFLFPAWQIIIPLVVLSNFAISVTGGFILKAGD